MTVTRSLVNITELGQAAKELDQAMGAYDRAIDEVKRAAEELSGQWGAIPPRR